MDSHEACHMMYIRTQQHIPFLLTITVYATSVFKTTEHTIGANLLETLFVLSFNHTNPQLRLIALTISPFLVIGAKTNNVSRDKNLQNHKLLNIFVCVCHTRF
jgi:hypothetical protein